MVGDVIQGVGRIGAGGGRHTWRAVSLFTALALLAALFVVGPGADVAEPAAPAAVESVGGGAAQSAVAAAAVGQIDVAALIRAIVCPILDRLAGGPLGNLIGPIINALRARFGCLSP